MSAVIDRNWLSMLLSFRPSFCRQLPTICFSAARCQTSALPGYGLLFILPYFPPMYNLRICKITVFPGFAALFPVTKKQPSLAALFGEGISSNGVWQKLYNVLGGFQSCSWRTAPKSVCTKFTKMTICFCAFFYSFLYIRFY